MAPSLQLSDTLFTSRHLSSIIFNVQFDLVNIFFQASWCLTLEPYPTINVTRYERQTFNCSVDSNWSSVSYYYGVTNIAFFLAQDAKCNDLAAPLPELYTTYCDDTSRTFHLTINNVTDDYSGKTIQCTAVYNTGAISDLRSIINVQCK